MALIAFMLRTSSNSSKHGHSDRVGEYPHMFRVVLLRPFDRPSAIYIILTLTSIISKRQGRSEVGFGSELSGSIAVGRASGSCAALGARVLGR
jgi:hypothetical protein